MGALGRVGVRNPTPAVYNAPRGRRAASPTHRERTRNMIVEFTNRRGQRTFTMTRADLVAATEWARSMCHLVYGPEEGEARFRALPARQVLSLWAVRPNRDAEA